MALANTRTPQSELARRGLTNAANEAGWRPSSFGKLVGWSYPVYDLQQQLLRTDDGKVISRWKNLDSGGKPKYLWLPEKPKREGYYLLADTLLAIQAAKGICFLASGEPDLIAYRAAGIRNVICWFNGEKFHPESLIEDLQRMGITHLIDYPDRDEPGLRKACRLMDLLDGSPIRYSPRKLPGEIGSKNDINWLWMEVEFNVDRFSAALLNADAYEVDELAQYRVVIEETPKTPLPAQSTFTDAQHDAIENVALARFFNALKAHAELRPKVKRSRNHLNYQCDLPGHDDKTASAGLNIDTFTYTCFVCGSFKGEDYGRKIGISLDYYRQVVAEEFEQSAKKPATPANLLTLPPSPEIATPPRKLYTASDDALADVEAVLRGERLPSYEPMPFPYTSFHKFGGFAELMIPGKLTYIMGVSGGGKTSFAEYISEVGRMGGMDDIWFSPEWTAQESQKRSIQRMGGMTVIEMAKYELWLMDKKHMKPPDKRRGTAPSQERLNETLNKVQQLKAWRGKSYQLNADPALCDLSSILQVIRDIVIEKRAAGRTVSSLFVDYIQRIPKVGRTDWERLETVANEVKSLCEELVLFGYILIQPKKSDSKATRDGAVLDESAAQGLSDQQSNLYIAMTPVFNDVGQKLPFIKSAVVKNSMGQTGEIVLKWAQQLLSICDAEVVVKQPAVYANGQTPKQTPEPF